MELRTLSPLEGRSVCAGVSQIYASMAMLRISRMSGEELAIAVDEDLIPDVRALKQHLHQLHGLPPHFRQRLLLHRQCLEDTAALRSSMDLELVLLAFIPNRSPDEMQEFTAAAGAGDLEKVRELTRSRVPHASEEQIK